MEALSDVDQMLRKNSDITNKNSLKYILKMQSFIILAT